MMALVRRDPWSLVDRLQEDMNRALGLWSVEKNDAGAAWTPAVDVDEHADHFTLFVDMPGVPADQVQITLEDGVLTLRGERKPRDVEEKVTRRRVERSYGRFERRFLLPDSVEAEGVTARESNGVLEITIPKRAAVLPRRIEIAA
jgi:HSP20 family protein